ncbi:DUF2627 domain-containing protein [Lonsdalea quercina]
MKRGSVLYMNGIFRKEVLSTNVHVEYHFSVDPYFGASSSNDSNLSVQRLRAV